MSPPQIIETRRLTLRQPVMTDAEAVFTSYSRDVEVVKYLTWRPHENVEETRDFVRRCISAWEERSAYAWIITRNEDGRLIGMIESRIEGFGMNLGYVL